MPSRSRPQGFDVRPEQGTYRASGSDVVAERVRGGVSGRAGLPHLRHRLGKAFWPAFSVPRTVRANSGTAVICDSPTRTYWWLHVHSVKRGIAEPVSEFHRLL